MKLETKGRNGSSIHLPKKRKKELEQYLGETEPEWLFLDTSDLGIFKRKRMVLLEEE